MIIFASRVLKIYLRDKTAVFFSLLSSFIIIGLYILFLGETYSSSFEQIGKYPSVDGSMGYGRIASNNFCFNKCCDIECHGG